MYKAIIWGLGKEYNKYINSIKLWELHGELQVIGVTAKEQLYRKIDGYQFIAKEDIVNIEYDLLIIASDNFFIDIKNEAILLQVPEEKIVNARIFTRCDLEIDKYILLKQSKLSVFSLNCWGIHITDLVWNFYRQLLICFLRKTSICCF